MRLTSSTTSVSSKFAGLSLRPARSCAAVPPPYLAGAHKASALHCVAMNSNNSNSCLPSQRRRVRGAGEEDCAIEEEEPDAGEHPSASARLRASRSTSPKRARVPAAGDPCAIARARSEDCAMQQPIPQPPPPIVNRSASYESGSVSHSGSQSGLAVSLFREDAFRVQVTRQIYSNGKHGSDGLAAGLSGSSCSASTSASGTNIRLDPDTQVFGQAALRDVLVRCLTSIRAPEDRGGPLAATDEHLFWHTSPYSSGARTMVEAFCDKHRLNLLVAWTKAPRNVSDICTEIPHTDGQYSALLRDAVSCAPCVVFIDRLDHHFEYGYERAGHELIGTWDSLAEVARSRRVPTPPVFIVISSAVSVGSMVGLTAVSPFNRMHHHETFSTSLTPSECVTILVDGYMHRACRAGIVLYDTRSPVTSVVAQQHRQRSAPDSPHQSEYDAHRSAVLGPLKLLGETMHLFAHSQNWVIKSGWFVFVIEKAFVLASRRVTLSTTPTPLVKDFGEYLPRVDELWQAARMLPLAGFKNLAPPSEGAPV